MAKNFDQLAAPLYADPKRLAHMAEYREQLEAELLAYQLAELRKEMGIDQTELGKRVGMTQAGVSKFERSADPKISTLRKFARALGADIHIEIVKPAAS